MDPAVSVGIWLPSFRQPINIVWQDLPYDHMTMEESGTAADSMAAGNDLMDQCRGTLVHMGSVLPRIMVVQTR